MPSEHHSLRIARHTERLDEVVKFYRDGLGLPEIGGFRGHEGYDGAFLAVPGTRTHLEFTAGGGCGAPRPHDESLIVLYLGDQASVDAVLESVAAEPLPPANPYWADHGVTIADPDGFRIVLVPEHWQRDNPAVQVGEQSGARDGLRGLFELAEDSRPRLDAYIEAGRVLVARVNGAIVGHLQLTDTSDPAQLEIKNMAVLPSLQGRGVGRALLDAAFALARDERRTTLTVATAAADIGNLRFYQRCGFRMSTVERDAFTPATGYREGIAIDGIELRDRVWLEARA